MNEGPGVVGRGGQLVEKGGFSGAGHGGGVFLSMGAGPQGAEPVGAFGRRSCFGRSGWLQRGGGVPQYPQKPQNSELCGLCGFCGVRVDVVAR